MQQRLIIFNADDLGLNSQRSHGIFQAFEFGVVRSASLVANGTDSDTAGRHARERELAAGLHLTLTQGFPLSDTKHIASLFQGNGEFYPVERFETLIKEGEIDKAHVEREVRAQMEWMLDTYGQPTHLSSHDHVHTHPFIVQILLPILDRYAIGAVRIPAEEPLPPFGFSISDQHIAIAQKITTRALAARKLYAANQLRMTDHFRGLALAGNASQKNLRHILSRFPEGSVELMVNPSSMTPYGTPHDLDPQRQTELNMLLNDEVPVILKERGITLGSFEDLL